MLAYRNEGDFLISFELLLRKLRASYGQHLHVWLPCKRQRGALVFVTGWKLRERLATPVAEIRDVQTDCFYAPSLRPDQSLR